MKKSKVSLPAEVAVKYKLVNWTGGHTQDFGRWGTVSIENLTLQKADILFTAKFPKLELKPQKKSEKNTEKQN